MRTARSSCRSGSAALALLLLAPLAAAPGCACPNTVCGPGTHEEGNRCVPDEPDDGREGFDDTGADDGPDGADDAPGDAADGEPDDSGDWDGFADLPPCRPCADGEQRCEGRQVQVCVTLTDGCTAWSVERTCSRFEECLEPEMDCVVPETEPPGSFLAAVPGASWGIAPESMLWDGTEGLVSYGTASGSIRVLGFLRFGASGPVRPARTLTTDDQESSLARASGRIFVHWRDFGSHASIGEVLSDESLGTSISSDHNAMGQNVHAFGVGTGVVLYQTSVMGGSNAYLGFFDPASWSIDWYADQPLFAWWTSTAAAVATPGGFAAAWITTDGSSVALGRFDAAGAPADPATVSPLSLPVESATALALLAEPEGFTFVWTTGFALHLGSFDAAGSLVADTTAETGDLPMGAARWAGSEGAELFVYCNGATRGTALVVARLNREGALLGDLLVTSHGAVARYAGGTIAACWGVPDEGIGCGVLPFP